MAAAKNVLIQMHYGVVGIGDKGDVLDVKKTPEIAGIIESGYAFEVAAKDVTSVVFVGTAAEREAGLIDEPVEVAAGGSGS